MFPRRKVVLLFALLLLVSASALFSAEPNAASFVDPTARVIGKVNLGHKVYVAPFAILDGSKNEISVGDETDVQDNVQVDATNGPIKFGSETIIAHGATVTGGASIGIGGKCNDDSHDSPSTACPSFVGFNAVVDGAIIQMNAMVTHLARVGPGVTIPSGRKVKPGKWVRSNDEVESKTDEVTKEDRKFMHDVVHVNVAFAEEYPKLAKENRANVRGINYNPSTEFNEQSRLPTLEGVPTRDPGFRNRIIGDVKIKKDNLGQLNKVMGSQISLRADEGHPFEVDSIAEMSDHVTFHALEFTSMHLGANGTYGPYSLVHGGELKEDRSITKTGDNVTLGAHVVFFRSTIGANSTVGDRSLVQDSVLPANTVIGRCEVWLNGEFAWKVEWCP